MKLVLGTLVLAVLIGSLWGGSLANLGRLTIRWTPLALVGLILQFILPPGRWPLVLLVVSFVLLFVFAIANRAVSGFTLILVGITLNFAVIALNSGMPVAQRALVASGQQDTLAELTSGNGVKHHLAGPGDTAMFLGDVIAIPQPIGQIVSVGDIFTYAGVAWVVVMGMRRKRAPIGPAAQAPASELPEASGVR